MRAIRRLLPDGMAGRFALLLAAALVAANLVALGVLSLERARLDRAALVDRETERIASLVPAIEAAEVHRRKAIAARASTRFSRVSVDPVALVDAQPAAPRSVALARTLAEALGGRDVRSAIMAGPDHRGRRHHESLAVSIPLETADGGPPQWLNVATRGAPPGPPGVEEEVFLLILCLSLASVLGVALVFARRLTRPLSHLAAAARAAGRGDRAARVAEAGPREMREAAAAFNDMQSRIAQFDGERMRVLAAVGHDLRTPITSLRIRAEMLEAAEAEPMIRTLDEMRVMADGLVAYARGAGDGEEAREIDLAPLVERLCDERGAEFRLGQDVRVSARPVALGRAIGNLVDNALRYGGATLVTLQRDRNDAVVTVDDDGPGIPPERQAAMFEPFARGEDSRSAETGGAGLGLAIARNIVAAHGGTVSLENLPKGGLRVTVRIPAR